MNSVCLLLLSTHLVFGKNADKIRKSQSRLMSLDDESEYLLTLSPTEKAVHKNLQDGFRRSMEIKALEFKLQEEQFQRELDKRIKQKKSKKNITGPRLRSSKQDGRGSAFDQMFQKTEEQTKGSENNCTWFFQDHFYGIVQDYRSLSGHSYTPVRKRVKVKENLKKLGNWQDFYETGKSFNSSGAPACFQGTARGKLFNDNRHDVEASGPCAKFYKGSECEFYPEMNYRLLKYPGCCDPTGCFCECISVCYTRDMVKTDLKSILEEQDFFKPNQCTTAFKTLSEGTPWKNQLCKEDIKEKSFDYMEALQQCDNKVDDVECVGGGMCVDKKICRHCYRWKCKNHQQKTCQKGSKNCAEHYRDLSQKPKRPKRRCRPRPGRQRCRRRRRKRPPQQQQPQPSTMAKNKYPLPTLSRRTAELEIKSKSQRQQQQTLSDTQKILEKRRKRKRKRLPLQQSNKPKLRSYASQKKLEQYFDISAVPDYVDFLPIYRNDRDKRLWKRQVFRANKQLIK